MKRNRLALAATTGALALGAALATSTGTATAATPWQGCAVGDICVYSELNGYGSVCAWDGDDPDWQGGAIRCSWSSTKAVKSIWNRGTGGSGSYRHVKFYFGADSTNYYACAAQGFKGNTGPDAGAKLKSHQWVTNC
ncbi:peptidase inhibitor family I36 protein [Streptomyces tanashiensis]|uniref:peptidase inhibitor family I36 protein n=1 Tax=Streptomyces tanashiensis TaxID=67367 RepID=UPI003682F031